MYSAPQTSLPNYVNGVNTLIAAIIIIKITINYNLQFNLNLVSSGQYFPSIIKPGQEPACLLQNHLNNKLKTQIHPKTQIIQNMGHSFVQRVSPSPTFIWTVITLESWASLSFSFLRATVSELWSSSLEINSFSQFSGARFEAEIILQQIKSV